MNHPLLSRCLKYFQPETMYEPRRHRKLEDPPFPALSRVTDV